MDRYRAAALLFAATLLVCTAARTVRAGDDPPIPQDQITMNFQNVDIPVLAKFISEITGKNFIIDESVRGKVTIISPTKVTPEEAYQAFQSALQIKGFTTVQTGKTIKIIPSRNVRSDAPLTESQLPAETRGDEYVTRMIKLKNVDASSLVTVVQPMISHDGLVAAYPEDNTLIITDDAYNVERLLKIIGSLDIQGLQKNVAVIPLKLAFAGELAPEIEQIMGARENQQAGQRPGVGVVAPAATSGGTAFKIIPDERTNSLIVLAGPLQMNQIQDIVAKLDIQPPNATSRIHVYRLKNAQALEMLQVLSNLLGGGGSPTTLSPTTGKGSLGRGSALGMFNGLGSGLSGGGGGGYGGYGSSGYGNSGYGGLGGGMMGSSLGGGGFGGGMSGMGGGGGGIGGGMGMMRSSGNSLGSSGATMSASSGGGATGPGGRNPDFVSPVNVTADPATNALVVSAAPQDWQTLKQIIDELDVPRTQIFVQAIIVEVSAERTKDIGVEFQASTNLGGNTIGIGQLNFGNLQNALGNPLGLTGLGIGLASGSMCSIPVAVAGAVSGSTTTGTTTSSTISAPCDVALMTALETDTHANVLSAPTLLTADNEEAMIIVGQNLPFVGSAAANAGLPGQIFNSVDRQNVGITLDMVPQVSEGDYVKLDLYEEVSNVVNGTQNNSLGPTTTIRSASTEVFVQNHRTAVIGGLLSSQDTIENQGVPYISNIPVLGNLFSNKSSDRQKLNLLVFLTPHVVRTRAQLRALALDERQRFINSLGRREMHDMPASQIHELYKPSFSISVPPEADLGGTTEAPGVPRGSAPPLAAPPPASGETPFNTEEIGPSSMSAPATGSVAASGVPGVPVSTSGSAAAGGSTLGATRATVAPAAP
ncbi:MAG TPA: type II secretion system secretin GspD [Candidatus Binataceae bacterium]